MATTAKIQPQLGAVDREWDEAGTGVCVPAPVSVKDQIRKRNEEATIRSRLPSSNPASVPTFTTAPLSRKVSKGFAFIKSNTPSKVSPASSQELISTPATEVRPSVLKTIRMFETRAAANFANGRTGSSEIRGDYGGRMNGNLGGDSINSLHEEQYGSDRDMHPEQSRREYEIALAEAMRSLDSERRLESRRRKTQDERWDELARQGRSVPEGEIERAIRDRQVVDEQWEQRARDIRQFVRKNYELKFVISDEARENRFLALQKMKERSLSDLTKMGEGEYEAEKRDEKDEASEDGEYEADKRDDKEEASEDEEYEEDRTTESKIDDERFNNNASKEVSVVEKKLHPNTGVQVPNITDGQEASEDEEYKEERTESKEENYDECSNNDARRGSSVVENKVDLNIWIEVTKITAGEEALENEVSGEHRTESNHKLYDQCNNNDTRREVPVVESKVHPNSWMQVPRMSSSRRNLIRPGIVVDSRSELVGSGMKMSVSFDDVMLTSHTRNESLSPCPGTASITPNHSREPSVSPALLTPTLATSPETTSPISKQGRCLSDLSDDEYRKFRDQATSMLVEVMEENHIMVPSKLLPHLRVSKENVLRRKFWSLGSRKDKSLKTFGVSLETLTERDTGFSTTTVINAGTAIPEIVSSCIDFIENEGLNTHGVFRVSGNARKIDSMKQAWDGGSVPDGAEIMSTYKAGINDAAGLLKLFLRELPDPLLTFKLFKPFMGLLDIKDVEQRQRAYRYLVVLLPRHNREVARRLFGLLSKIAANSGVNAMDANNLGIVIAPNVLKEKAGRLKKADVANFAKAAQIVKEMIEIGSALFEVPEMTTRAPDPLPLRPKSARSSVQRLLEAIRRRASI